MAEVIDISDDDIIIEEDPKPKFGGIVTKKPFRCLNSDCRTEKDLVWAQEYVRRYYGVLPYPKKRRVCVRCRDEAKQQQDGLVETILSGRLLLGEKLPPPKTTVILTDSDSDPSDVGPLGSESELEYDGEESLEEAIAQITKNLGLDRQLLEGRCHLEDRFIKLQEGFENLNAEYSKVESGIDTVRKDFYNTFRPEIVWLPVLDIGPSSIVIQQEGVCRDPLDPLSQGEVIAETPMYVPNENLPPVGRLERWELQPNELVYSMKYSLFARWVQAQVIEVEKRDTKGTMYKIRYNRNTKSAGLPKVMSGRNLAYINPCATRIPVGTRVIAKYRDDDPKNTTISGSFYVGIVAEIPTAANKYRYLIFFDDGYAQYVLHHDIRVVTEASQCPWEDVSSDAREFIRDYLKLYPERPMVRLQKWNYVRTEWNGRWWKAQVKEVDGSLVKMFFPLDGRSEWIYRGSFRLSPLFNKKLNIQAQSEQPLRTIRRRTAAIPGRGAVVEYGTFGQGQDNENTESSNESQGERRAVARKSTSSRPGTPPREIMVKVEQESKGSFTNHSYNDKVIEFKPHAVCTHRCLADGDSMEKYKGVSPLLYPLIYGWQRQVCRQRKKSVTKHDIYYVAPCGRRLRSIEDIFQYLRITESALEIDCFSFEIAVDVSSEWEPFRKLLYVEDISKGEENVSISGVNSLDTTEPQELMYCNVRLPTEHVPLNLDPDFLICCDCVDDCQDKSKCACWQMTIQNTAILEQTVNYKAGYEYRRLYEQVQSGIYECYSRCKCSAHCLNRVVQHPLRLKLQLFKTARRGWGVRTLHDIPRGGFICVYVGRMLNETMANEEGKISGGDDYYAELDYIEVMERAKDDYEDEPIDPELDNLSKNNDPDNDKDNDKEISGSFAKLLTRELRRTTSTGGSESNDSDSFYSENEPDNPNEDHDFGHPAHMRKAGRGLAKREKSARIMERAAKRSRLAQGEAGKEDGSGSGSAMASDDESRKEKENDRDENDKKMENEEKKDTEGDQTKEANEEQDGDGDDDDDDDGEEEADNKQRQRQMFAPSQLLTSQPAKSQNKTLRSYFGENEAVYIMDAKRTGNIGRFLNHSCDPNVFVQNVFVDTHDLRFPWVAFFAMCNIRAGKELTWDYSYEVDSVPGRVKYCYCGARKCRGRLL